MKRVEAIIGSEKVLDVNEALKKVGVSGCTILDAKGRGKGEKPMIESGRGTGKFASEFSVRSNIVTIVDTVSTGSTGDGKIFISPISEAIDIGTKKRGEVAVL